MRKYKEFENGKIYKFSFKKYVKDIGFTEGIYLKLQGKIVTDIEENKKWGYVDGIDVHRDWCKVVKSNDN